MRFESHTSTLFARCRLVIAGGYDQRVVENVEYDMELRALARRHNLSVSDFPDMSGQIIFLHSFTDDQRWYLLDRCRLVIYTPENEHFGIVPIEAMYCGRPVVAVNSGGPTESVQHRRTGLLCASNPHDFAQAMMQLYTDPELARSMGAQGRQRVIQRFSFESFTSRLDTMVQELTRSKPRRLFIESRAFIFMFWFGFIAMAIGLVQL